MVIVNNIPTVYAIKIYEKGICYTDVQFQVHHIECVNDYITNPFNALQKKARIRAS